MRHTRLTKAIWNHSLSALVCVAGIFNGVGGDKLLLHGAQADEAGEQVGTASLVVGTAGTSTTERLLADDGTSALAVDIEVTGSVAQSIAGNLNGLTVLGKDRAGQTIGASVVDLVADLEEVGLSSIVIGVDDDDGSEKLAGKERVVGVGSAVDSGLDVPSLGRIIRTTSQELKLGVALGLIDNTGELVEGTLMDNGATKVGELGGLANLQLVDLSSYALDKLVGNGRSDVGTGSGTALLALELKGTTDGLDHGVTHIGGLVDQVEVLATGLAHDTGVAAVFAIRHTLGDFAIQRAEDISAASEVEGGKFLVLENGAGDLLGITGNELDDVLGQTGLKEDLVNKPVGGHGSGRGLPQNDVTHQSGSTSQVTTDGSEVEGADGVDETLERAVLQAVPDTGGVVNGLLSIDLLGVLDSKAEEIDEFCGRVNLRLPGVLALAVHGQSHDIVTVLGRDQIGSLQEDAGALRKGGISPRLACGESGVNGSLNIGLGGVGVSSNGGMGGRVALGEGLGGLDLLASDDERQVQWRLLIVGSEGILQTLAIRGTGNIVFLKRVN